MNLEDRISTKKTARPARRTDQHPDIQLWTENPDVAEFERRFYRDTVDAMIRAERPATWGRRIFGAWTGMLRRVGAGLASLLRWRPSVPATSVDLGKVIRDLETPVQNLASSCSEHRRRTEAQLIR